MRVWVSYDSDDYDVILAVYSGPVALAESVVPIVVDLGARPPDHDLHAVWLDDEGRVLRGTKREERRGLVPDDGPNWWCWSRLRRRDPDGTVADPLEQPDGEDYVEQRAEFAGVCWARDRESAVAAARLHMDASIAAGDLERFKAELARKIDERIVSLADSETWSGVFMAAHPCPKCFRETKEDHDPAFRICSATRCRHLHAHDHVGCEARRAEFRRRLAHSEVTCDVEATHDACYLHEECRLHPQMSIACASR